MSDTLSPSSKPVWNLAWLTPVRCRLILALMLTIHFVGHIVYLHLPGTIDLSGDEAQYWDWSRHLDLSYYSKGPAIAYIIRASTELFGNTMPAVRYPALFIGVCTSIVTYLLTRLLFGSERLALGATLLFGLIPLFAAGSVLMTIDPPMFLCWALATYFAARRIFSTHAGGLKSSAEWAVAGVFIGLGFLAKYAEFLWFIGLFGFLISQRRKLSGAFSALVAAAIFTLPVLVWNQQHNWVSLRHVARQTGAEQGAFDFKNILEMLGGQIGTVGPTVAVLMTAAVIWAIVHRNDDQSFTRELSREGADAQASKLAAKQLQTNQAYFLVWIGVPFFLLNLFASFRAKVQLNWPAPAYFSLIILTAFFLSRKLQTQHSWSWWRPWFWATIVIGLIVMPIAHDTTLIYPLLKHYTHKGTKEMEAIDPLARLRGWKQLGEKVQALRDRARPGTFVMCDDYQQTAEMAFYLPDHPTTFCAGPYFGKRLSQYDLWPDHRLGGASPLVGRDAIYIGKGEGLPGEVIDAFDHVEKLPSLPILIDGVLVRTFKIWRGQGFRGMSMPGGLQDY